MFQDFTKLTEDFSILLQGPSCRPEDNSRLAESFKTIQALSHDEFKLNRTLMKYFQKRQGNISYI